MATVDQQGAQAPNETVYQPKFDRLARYRKLIQFSAFAKAGSASDRTKMLRPVCQIAESVQDSRLEGFVDQLWRYVRQDVALQRCYELLYDYCVSVCFSFRQEAAIDRLGLVVRLKADDQHFASDEHFGENGADPCHRESSSFPCRA